MAGAEDFTLALAVVQGCLVGVSRGGFITGVAGGLVNQCECHSQHAAYSPRGSCFISLNFSYLIYKTTVGLGKNTSQVFSSSSAV